MSAAQNADTPVAAASGQSNTPASSEIGRKRRWAPKTRTGCGTCRLRHVKCDEQRPECKRCVTTGLFCRGYVNSPWQSTAAQDRWTPSAIIRPGSLCRQPAIRVSPTDTKMRSCELGLFYHYRTVVAGHIADEFNRSLWAQNFPQTAHHNRSIYYACTMYAAAHQQEEIRVSSTPTQTDQIDKLQSLALHHYSLSLKGIIEVTQQATISDGDKSTILAANTLFLASAFSRGDMAESLQHLRNGLALIQQWRIWEFLPSPTTTTSSALDLLSNTSLLLFYVQLDALAQESLSALPTWQWGPALMSLCRRSICSPSEACLELDIIWLGLVYHFKTLPFTPGTEEINSTEKYRCFMSRYFGFWRTRFHRYRSLAANLSTIDRGLLVILEMRQLLVDVLLRVDVSKLQTSWDMFEPEFDRAITLIEFLLRPKAETSSKTRESSRILAKSFSFTPPITTSLQFLTTYCRFPDLRRRAISLLREQWRIKFGKTARADKTYITQTAELIMRLEEEGWSESDGVHPSCPCIVGKFICNDHRVAEHRIRHTGTYTGELLLRTMDDVVKGRPVRTIPLKVERMP